jgi:hypothetical protein
MAYFGNVGGAQGLNPAPENPCTLIDFARLVLAPGESHEGATGEREALLVLLGGR